MYKQQGSKHSFKKVRMTGENKQVNIIKLVHIELIMRFSVRAHIHLFVLCDSPLEEIGLAVNRGVEHEGERIRRHVERLESHFEQQMIGDVLDIFAHELRVHAEPAAEQREGYELFFDFDCL